MSGAEGFTSSNLVGATSHSRHARSPTAVSIGPQGDTVARPTGEFQLCGFAACDLCRRTLGIGVMMRRLLSWAVVLFVFAQFAGWASVSEAAAARQPRSKAAAAPQSGQQVARLARLYFLRENGVLASETGIKIDGQPVGSVSKGFYFSVDKPPGRYRIACAHSLSMMDYSRGSNRGWTNLLFRRRHT